MSHFVPAVDERSDIVLRSADGVDYALHSRQLGKLSSVFSDMFASAHASSQPIIVDEPASTLDLMLPILYEESSFSPLSQQNLFGLATLYEFCAKYGLSMPIFDLVKTSAQCVATRSRRP